MTGDTKYGGRMSAWAKNRIAPWGKLLA